MSIIHLYHHVIVLYDYIRDTRNKLYAAWFMQNGNVVYDDLIFAKIRLSLMIKNRVIYMPLHKVLRA